MKSKLPISLMLLLMLLGMKLSSQRIDNDPNFAISRFLNDPWANTYGVMDITIIPSFHPAKHYHTEGIFVEKSTVQLGKKKGSYNVLSSHNKFPPEHGTLGASIGSFSKTQSFGTLWDGNKMIPLPKASNVITTYSSNGTYTFLMEFDGNRLSITIYTIPPG